MKRMLFLGVLLILAGRVCGQSATGVLVIRGGTLVDVRAGKEDRLGTLEPGKLADLVVLDADPLAAIENVKKVHTVVQGGRVYEPSALLEQALSDVQKKP